MPINFWGRHIRHESLANNYNNNYETEMTITFKNKIKSNKN